MTAPHEVIDLDSYDDSSSLSDGHTGLNTQRWGNETTPRLMNNEPSIMDEFHPNLTVTDPDQGGSRIPDSRPPAQTFEECCIEVTEVFPDICHDYVRRLYDKHLGPLTLHQYQGNLAQVLIEDILDHGGYPKERDRLKALKELKRKRDDLGGDDDDDVRWKTDVDKHRPVQYHTVAKAALLEAFQFIPSNFISEKLIEHGNYYAAYMAIVEAERAFASGQRKPYSQLKKRRAPSGVSRKDMIRSFQIGGHSHGGWTQEIEQEIEAAHRRRRREDDKRDQDARKAAQGEADAISQREQGAVIECGCCFDEIPLSEVTHCNGDVLHFFCFDCARRNADNDIGANKYRLQCMDASICEATFSKTERARFLDDRTMLKLESIEQEAVLRLAEVGFEDFVSCPFCHYGHICPPLAIDKEFRCRLSDCGEISCRLCKERSHVPSSCEEHKKENGISERRVIEEARTEALIRTCPKCKVRILKEDGCNKVICTTCYTVICDYCGKDISKIKYSHFDGQGTGVPGTEPGPGKCPLYDQNTTRKHDQIEAAGKDAMEKVRKENPDLSEDDLKIKFSKEVEIQNGGRVQHPYHPLPHPLPLPHNHLPRYPHAFVPGPIWPVPAQAVPDLDEAMQYLRRDQGLDAMQEQIQLQQERQVRQAQQIRLQQERRVRQVQLDMQRQVELLRQRTNDTREQVQRDMQQQVEQMRQRQDDPANHPVRGFRQQLEHLQRRQDDARHERQRLQQDVELLRARQREGRPEGHIFPFGLGVLPEMGALQYEGFDPPQHQIPQQQGPPYDPGNFQPHILPSADELFQYGQEDLPRAENIAVRQEEAGRRRERGTDQARRQYQPPRAG